MSTMAKGFQPGNKLAASANPAREFINGLRKKFEDNAELIYDAVEREIHSKPTEAYLKYYVPLIPKSIEQVNNTINLGNQINIHLPSGFNPNSQTS